MNRLILLAATAGSLVAAPALHAAPLLVGSTPLVHPANGLFPGQLSIDFTPGWWDTPHSGSLTGSGFTWTYDPVAFGEGFSKTFEVQNIARPNMTKVMTITLTGRSSFMPPSPVEICADALLCNSNNGKWDFWPNVTFLTGPEYPWFLIGASNLGFNNQTNLWSGQFQFRIRPQPAAEYVTFEQPKDVATWNRTVENLASMTLDITCVPEPSTWAMMIIGFGAVGGSVRRRRAIELAETA